MSENDSSKAKIIVPSEDPEKKETLEDRKQKEHERQMRLVDKAGDKDEIDEGDDELSEEDLKLKQNLETLVKTVLDGVPKTDEEAALQKTALTQMCDIIRSATSTMTSVPKPLKFLRPHYQSIVDYHSELDDAVSTKGYIADVCSILAMTMGKPGERTSLKYKLVGSDDPVGAWGHEYVRNLAGEIGQEYDARRSNLNSGQDPTAEGDEKSKYDDLNALVDAIVPFNIEHNAEYEAIDLLIEVERTSDCSLVFTADNYDRACRYLLACGQYIGDPDEQVKMLQIAYESYLKFEDLANALRVALRLDDRDRMAGVFTAAGDDELMKKQLAFICSTHRVILEDFEEDEDLEEELLEIMGNVSLNEHFMTLAAELDVKKAKSPEDIYKSHLVEGKAKANTSGGPTVDSAKQNLASSFVNGFVNCGFGNDNLITPDGSDWLYKNKSHGMMSAAASLGMILLWDVETGFSTVDKYSFSQQSMIKAGALLATGMLSSGVTSEMDAALALLQEHVEESENAEMRIAAVLGLGLAYAGSNREDVLEALAPLIVDDTQSMEIASLTCLALGMVFVGTANDDISGSILEAFLDRSDTDLNDSTARWMCLGMGLLFLGTGEQMEGALAASAMVDHPIQKYLALTIRTCAYVGSCSVLEVQNMLKELQEHIEDESEEKADEKGDNNNNSDSNNADHDERKNNPLKGMHQGLAVLGVAMISMGEQLGADMALRSLDHILQYGELNVRRAVPLALGLLSVSNPQISVMDNLAKLAHDQDQQVSQNAVLSLGLIGAGTNNSRIANILRQLAGYYGKEPDHLFLVRIAQGLLHMSKGLVTLSPFHSDNFLMSKVGIAGLLALMHSCLDLKNTVLAKKHYILFSVVCALRPRMLVILDEDLEPLSVPVRVGQAVDITGQMGKPKSITGFQTHNTPVLLSVGERAELATNEYIPLTNVLEGFVIVKKNPNKDLLDL